jgi:hypothetical protein
LQRNCLTHAAVPVAPASSRLTSNPFTTPAGLEALMQSSIESASFLVCAWGTRRHPCCAFARAGTLAMRRTEHRILEAIRRHAGLNLGKCLWRRTSGPSHTHPIHPNRGRLGGYESRPRDTTLMTYDDRITATSFACTLDHLTCLLDMFPRISILASLAMDLVGMRIAPEVPNTHKPLDASAPRPNKGPGQIIPYDRYQAET